ncbi:MAG: polysaccharide biosynthesis/export family protein [Cyclobacteriaceae bacterium]|nr:polysaccharide biosynthesis/export family protein [Cyclobacteriaceae bacterium]
MKILHWALWGGIFLLSGCTSYRQNIMFKTPEGFKGAAKDAQLKTDKMYVLVPGDQIQLSVFANKGEKAVDPSPEVSNSSTPSSTEGEPQTPKYQIDPAGISRLPMVGEVSLAGLTIRQAELMLEKAYADFFEKPFVTITCTSRRVIVLGAQGGQVIPLTHDPTHLVEVLAMGKGLANDAKAHNIRVLRGDQVFLVDFSTLAGYQAGNIAMQSGDVVYVEPIRRPLVEGLRDYTVFFSMFVSLGTLLYLIKNASK